VPGSLITDRAHSPIHVGPGSYSVANLDMPVFVGRAWVPPDITIESA
jgi:hypothetical protein